MIAASRPGHAPDPSPEALAALEKIFMHNDVLPLTGPVGRVNRPAACKMLRDAFGWNHGEHALEALCRRLGRRSWGAK